jgi:hypothetical protein
VAAAKAGQLLMKFGEDHMLDGSAAKHAWIVHSAGYELAKVRGNVQRQPNVLLMRCARMVRSDNAQHGCINFFQRRGTFVGMFAGTHC